MAEKRRLPIISNSAPAAPGQAGSPGGGGGEEQPPPWHWVPIGALVAIVSGVLLSKSFFMPYMQRQFERVYGRPANAAEFDRIDRALPAAARDALHLRLALAAVPVALLAVALGGFVVGRFGGGRTNARHGTLAGITAMLLVVLLAGRSVTLGGLLGYMALVPFGGLVGYLGALVGVALRARAQREH